MEFEELDKKRRELFEEIFSETKENGNSDRSKKLVEELKSIHAQIKEIVGVRMMDSYEDEYSKLSKLSISQGMVECLKRKRGVEKTLSIQKYNKE